MGSVFDDMRLRRLEFGGGRGRADDDDDDDDDAPAGRHKASSDTSVMMAVMNREGA
jgi:hypothetical protein